MAPPHPRRVPLRVKLIYSAFVAVLVPVYTWHYPLANFLWFSNIALLLGLFATWFENRWLASTQSVSVSLLEMFWVVDFIAGIFMGDSPTGMTEYMFDREIPLFIRALSLYHLVLPFFLLWLAIHLGYERRAWIAQTLLGWTVLLICYFFTNPELNVNWVFGLGEEPQTRIPRAQYLVILLAGFAAGVYLPTHLAIKQMEKWWRERSQS